MLADLLERGGVWYNVASSSPEQLIRETLPLLPLPPAFERTRMIQAILDREKSTSTAIGFGIALPHPVSLLLENENESIVSLAYPRYPLQWPEDSGEQVKAVFFVLSASRQAHLTALSQIARLCGQESFRALLYRQAGKKELLAAIQAAHKKTKPAE